MPLSPLPLLRSGTLTEFRFNEPLSAPTGTPANLFSYTLATTYVLLDDSEDRVWVNATARWYVTFSALGSANVTFTIYRNGVAVFSAVQSVFNPIAGAATVSNVVHLQYVDVPLSGTAVTALTPVTYSFAATTEAVGPIFTSGPVTLSVAEI
ncbi:MAG: hypothetical protein IMW97_05180 [Firmicutes bacterium]|nr:hypothetical protein [Candidatus Fermentithermobacillaceae bacterium]